MQVLEVFLLALLRPVQQHHVKTRRIRRFERVPVPGFHAPNIFLEKGNIFGGSLRPHVEHAQIAQIFCSPPGSARPGRRQHRRISYSY